MSRPGCSVCLHQQREGIDKAPQRARLVQATLEDRNRSYRIRNPMAVKRNGLR